MKKRWISRSLSLSPEVIEKLHEKGIMTVERLAICSVKDFVGILGVDEEKSRRYSLKFGGLLGTGLFRQ